MKKIIFSIYPILFARKSFEKLNRLLILLGLRGLGILNHGTNKISGESFFLKHTFSNYDINSVFDIGANIGDYAITCRELGFKGDILSFEPHPITFNHLKEKTPKHNIKLYNIGFSEEAGTLSIYDSSTSDGSEHASLHKEVLTDLHKRDIIEHKVDIDTIDNFLTTNKIENIDLLKIDTEGNELAILKGANKALSKIKIIHFEFNEMNVVSRAFFKDFYTLLSPNFNLYRLLPSSFLKIDEYETLFNEFFAYQNIIAIRKDIDKES